MGLSPTQGRGSRAPSATADDDEPGVFRFARAKEMILRPGAIASKSRRSNDRAWRNEAKMGDLSDGWNAAGSASSNEPSGRPLNLTCSYQNGGFREI